MAKTDKKKKAEIKERLCVGATNSLFCFVKAHSEQQNKDNRLMMKN